MVMIASWPAVAVAQGDSSVSDCHVPRALSALPPPPEGVKTLVRVGVFVIDVARIDETMESATMDLIVAARWNDPRLAADNFGRSLEHCHFLPGDVWEPGITLANQRGVISIEPGQLLVDRDGNVEFLRRYFLDLSTPFDLAKFPFDAQQLPVIVTCAFGEDEIDLSGDPRISGLMEGATLAGWTLSTVASTPSPARQPPYRFRWSGSVL
jgi:hypothetical protein